MDGKGGEFKRFDIQDGYGIRKLINSGVKVYFISGRYSAATQQRAEDLRITGCINGQGTSWRILRHLRKTTGYCRKR